jgi:predicted CXXCH cytochrome family protein
MGGGWTWNQLSRPIPGPRSQPFQPARLPRRERPGGNAASLHTDGRFEESRYVGDAACARCHGAIAQSYSNHPMGRSAAPLGEFKSGSLVAPKNDISFIDGGVKFTIESMNGRVVHTETLESDKHEVIFRNREEARYVIGSGRQGATLLIERGDGYLFSSPLSWYARTGTWNLAPGYRRNNPHFERPVRLACLNCHANRVELVEGSENHYRSPIFQGYAIGCERCHGPGERHAREPMNRPGQPPNIVNPANLAPHLRESVCQQCHLQADVRLLRAGRRWTDYHPGDALHEYVDVYIQPGQGHEQRALGQVEQMYASRCFQASQGSLGCISCHDPHKVPRPDHLASHYRERCLACHVGNNLKDVGAEHLRGEQAPRRSIAVGAMVSGPPCALPVSDRRKQVQNDSCIDCHMPRVVLERIPHAAASDHRIPRKPGKHPQSHAARGQHSPTEIDESFLVSFFRELRERDHLTGHESETDRERDLGIALSMLMPNPRLDSVSARDTHQADQLALNLLEKALTQRSEDPEAWLARGRMLERLSRRPESLDSFQQGLALVPERESLLHEAANEAIQLENSTVALPLLDRLIKVNPHRAEYHHLRALALTQARDWKAAAEACRASLELNAFNIEVRLMLIQLLVQAGDPAADAEMTSLLKGNPPGANELRRWFEEQKRP